MTAASVNRITSYNVCYTKLLRKVGAMRWRAGGAGPRPWPRGRAGRAVRGRRVAGAGGAAVR
ncbi:hypothetical protein [Streptomyces cyaneogriseus]|uniref:hypothetical protein n=1 Tax=Streptomyces cyaneogriseus TaxID=68192 RepID=UPI001331B030|nr:hypothetical protein [Streptomyces cyaneogriseus]